MAYGIDNTIRQRALERGCADAQIVTQYVRPYRTSEGEGGTWHILSVRRRDGAPWSIVGRRRTKAELLELFGAPVGGVRLVRV